jgi:hypothetical protein
VRVKNSKRQQNHYNFLVTIRERNGTGRGRLGNL